MYPTLLPGEYLLFDRWAYRRHAPKRGDVVLARGLLEGNKALIKRVVGVSGDEVKLIQGAVMVNGDKLVLPIPADEVELEEDGQWTIKDNEAFLLGDALEMSTDSRSFGPVPSKMIKARAWLVCWPPNRWRRLDTVT